MTLNEILNYIEFSAELDENGKIKLVDHQNVYLGNIGECRWEADVSSIPDIIERCEIYWSDYVITPLLEDIGCSEELEDKWEELYEYASKYYGDEKVDDNTILGYLINPSLIELDKELIGE